MTKDKREYDFVMHYFEAGRLNTSKALRRVRERAGIAPAVPAMRPTILRRAVAAAAVVLLIVFGAYMLLAPAPVTLQSAASCRHFTLPDGTRVTLAPHSTLSYSAASCRDVEMQGRIYFEVARDTAHPFDIRANDAHVRVLGTSFEVCGGGETSPVAAPSAPRSAPSSPRTAPSASVVVTSGRVLFAARHRDSDGLILVRGMRAVLPRGASRPVLSGRSDINDVAWATHKLHFSDAPMQEVLRVLGNCYGSSFTASDMSKRLTGDFDTASKQQVVRVIEQTLGIVITEN